jgi:tetratricopeptide (TPR) repeat protein
MELSSLASAANADALVDTINLVNFRKVTSWQYLMTQFGVICTYLRLLLLPVGQNFDYDYQLQRYFFHAAVLLPLCLLLLIAGTGIYLLYRSKDTVPVNRRLFKLIAFGIFWFYITLAIDSSIVPIDDLIFEHRAYLPSIGIFAAVLAGIISACRMCPGRFMTAPGTAFTTFMIIILCLSATSIARNRVWGDKITFWSDVAAKSPDKSRVHKYLGVALFEQGRTAEGIEEFRRAKMLSPGNVHARIMLGKALLVQRMYADAAGELLSATRMDPNNQLAQVVLGEVHEGQGDQLAAEKAYLAALAVAPAYPIAHQRLGELYDKQGKPAAAIREYEASLRLYPDSNVRKRLAVLKQMNKNLQRP